MQNKKLKPLPVLLDDAAAEDFVAKADLTQFDLSGGRVLNFEFDEKAAQLSMRVPIKLLAAIKSKAKRKKVPYTRYIRMLIERDLSAPS